MGILIWDKSGFKSWNIEIENPYFLKAEPFKFKFLGLFQDGSIEEFDNLDSLINDDEPKLKIVQIINKHGSRRTRFIRTLENNEVEIVNYFEIGHWKAIEIDSDDEYSKEDKTKYLSIQFEFCDPKGRMREGKSVFETFKVSDVALYNKIYQAYKLLTNLSSHDSFRAIYKSKKPIEVSSEVINNSAINSTALFKLNSLIGLNSVKEEINSLISFVKIRKKKIDRGLMVTPSTLHMVFTGNPGTGKTTVARIIGELYLELGLLSKGHCVEVSRTDLVGEYVGHTAPLVTKKFNEALGGVLFIDEAYQLIEGGEKDFGKEAISTLLKLMEDNREKLVVIVAGYPNDMLKFINSNPGLDSRFATKLHFEDFSGDEFFACLSLLLNEKNYNLSLGGQEKAKLYFEKNAIPNVSSFGNGRGIRNLFEKIERNQAIRLSKVDNPTDDQLLQIEADDIPL